MFKWLNRKQLEEQKKLLYQNTLAPAGMAAYFGQLGELAIAAELKVIEEVSREIAQTFPPSVKLPADQLTFLLKANRRLRVLFDQTSMRHMESFDDSYKPVLGWKSYFDFYD